jgi:orotidine-5'-phosphate decarboxylase
LLEKLLPHISMVKVGLEAMTACSESGFTVASLVCRTARELNIPVMWDIKLNDIPNTMAAAARNIAKMPGVQLFTLHASAGSGALKAVVEATQDSQAIPAAVTVLTSLDDADCRSIFGADSGLKVREFAEQALRAGIKSLVCSPRELDMFYGSVLGKQFSFIVPGVRPLWASSNDQKRVMTPFEAARTGADYVVIGRPIMEAADPIKAARDIREELDDAFVSA